MEQKTINHNKLQTFLCIIALTLGLLVSAVLFSMPPVHAAESDPWFISSNVGDQTFIIEHLYDGLSQQTTYSIPLTDSNYFYAFAYTGKKNTIGWDQLGLYAYSLDGSANCFRYYFPSTIISSTSHNEQKDGSYIDSSSGYFNSIEVWYVPEDYSSTHESKYHYTFSIPFFNSADAMKNYCLTGDKSGLISEPEVPDLTDDSYTYTGFSINGKTARWTGTTDRSYLKDQDVEEYTTITYAWATTTEPDNIGTFQEYNGEFPTSAKQLKLPWSDMENGKVNFQFIRQVNIIPCYRVPGAFYHGQAVKIFFKPDGSIEKVSDPNVTGVLDESIPIPILSVDNDQGTFVFTNAQNDYKFELKGRFWSTDDFYVYRNTPSLVWQYKYLTLLKNSLTTWVSVGDNKSVLDTFSFGDLGNESWQDLLNTYPIDQRNIITGQEQGWFSWANITGYNDAVSTLKMLLNSPYSLFNGYEVYVRYYVIGNDGIVKYSKWTHYFNNLASADGSTGSIVDDAGNMNNGSQSDKGLTDNDLNNVENSGNSRNDVDAKPSSDFGSVDIGDISGIFDQFLSVLKGLYSGMGQLPSFINAIFGFLPAWVTTMIGISIVFIIFLRILGR